MASRFMLWISQGGRVVCSDHLGYSASAYRAANPRARRLVTSLDVWERMTPEEVAEWFTFTSSRGLSSMCEDCHYGAPRLSTMFNDGSLRWVLDSGHGWLRVPLASCEGIAFSEFSYVDPRGGWAYLEEDDDAGMWVRCFDAGDVVIRVESFDGECFVRDLPSFPRVASVTGWAASVA